MRSVGAVPDRPVAGKLPEDWLAFDGSEASATMLRKKRVVLVDEGGQPLEDGAAWEKPEGKDDYVYFVNLKSNRASWNPPRFIAVEQGDEKPPLLVEYALRDSAADNAAEAADVAERAVRR